MDNKMSTIFYLVDYKGGAQRKNVLQQRINRLFRSCHRRCIAQQDLEGVVDALRMSIDHSNKYHNRNIPELLTRKSIRGDIYLSVGKICTLKLLKFIVDE